MILLFILVWGMFAGWIAHLLLARSQPVNWAELLIIGLAGSFVGGLLISLVYVSHFLVMPTVAVLLWIRNRARFLIWMRMVIALAVAGVTTYFLYPMAPPWLAQEGGVFPGGFVGRAGSGGRG